MTDLQSRTRFRIPDGYCLTCGAATHYKCSSCGRSVCEANADVEFQCREEHTCGGRRTRNGLLPVVGLDAVERAFDLISKAKRDLSIEDKLSWFFETLLPDNNPMIDGYHAVTVDAAFYFASMVPEEVRSNVTLDLEGSDPETLSSWYGRHSTVDRRRVVPTALRLGFSDD